MGKTTDGLKRHESFRGDLRLSSEGQQMSAHSCHHPLGKKMFRCFSNSSSKEVQGYLIRYRGHIYVSMVAFHFYPAFGQVPLSLAPRSSLREGTSNINHSQLEHSDKSLKD